MTLEAILRSRQKQELSEKRTAEAVFERYGTKSFEQPICPRHLFHQAKNSSKHVGCRCCALDNDLARSVWLVVETILALPERLVLVMPYSPIAE
jgi:hypothetical protein